MKIQKGTFLLLLCGLLTFGQAAPSFAAESIVKVSLWDKGPHSLDALGQGMKRSMVIKTGNMPAAMVGIDVHPKTIKSGTVTFAVTNISQDMIHEMVVSPVADPSKPLPYDRSLEKVDEDAAGHLGEVSELSPGQSGKLKLTLKPGEYILYCNIPGHYSLGMWTRITVVS